MTSVVVVRQWGDEGKGRLQTFYQPMQDFIARYQGGDNAGHTIVTAKIQVAYSFRYLLPGEFLSWNGVVINPKSLVKSWLIFMKKVWQQTDLRISDRAHVILPLPYQDRLKIQKGQILERPSKVDRLAYCVWESVAVFWTTSLRLHVEERTVNLQTLWSRGSFLWRYLRRILWVNKSNVTDTSVILNDALDNGKRDIFEEPKGLCWIS